MQILRIQFLLLSQCVEVVSRPRLDTAASDSKSEAESYFRKAIELAINQREKSLELRAVMSLSRLLIICGKDRAAWRILTKVCDGFTEGFDSTDMKEARNLLAGKSAR